MAWLSASLFLLPVMKLRVVRGMVAGDGGGNRNDSGGSYGVGWKEGRREGAASLACGYRSLIRVQLYWNEINFCHG